MVEESEKEKVVRKAAGVFLLAVFLVICGFAIYWDREPAFFDVRKESSKLAMELNVSQVAGSKITATLIHETTVLLDKPGGFLANDLLPPGALMDNIPSWEYGVLVQIRTMTHAMNDRLGRSANEHDDDDDLALAVSRFDTEPSSWIMPDAQDEIESGLDYLNSYFIRLGSKKDADVHFYANSENLVFWLREVQIHLTDLSQHLSSSVARKSVRVDVAADKKQGDSSAGVYVVKTEWFEIDDVFYEARGSSWALLHLLKAVELDFSDVLKKKQAELIMAQIIRELEATQEPLGSPVILNGSGFGLWANHSLVMASYLSRTNVAISELLKMLDQQ